MADKDNIGEYTPLEQLYGLKLYQGKIMIDNIPQSHREASRKYADHLENGK